MRTRIELLLRQNKLTKQNVKDIIQVCLLNKHNLTLKIGGHLKKRDIEVRNGLHCRSTMTTLGIWTDLKKRKEHKHERRKLQLHCDVHGFVLERPPVQGRKTCCAAILLQTICRLVCNITLHLFCQYGFKKETFVLLVRIKISDMTYSSEVITFKKVSLTGKQIHLL